MAGALKVQAPNKLMSFVFTASKFVFPVAIIGYLLWRLETEDWQHLSERSIAYPVLAGALGVAFTAILISFVRWWVLVRCQGITLSLIEALRLSSICFLLSFVSAGSVGGDLFKAVFLARRSPGKKIPAVASVVVDRGCGLYGLLLLVSIGLMIRSDSGSFQFNGIGVTEIKWIVGSLLVAGTAVLCTLVFGGKIVDRLMSQAASLPLVGSAIAKLGPPLRMFHHHPWAFALSLVMSVFVQGLLVVSMYLIAASMYASPPTLQEHFVIVPIGMLASALPITPAGIGVLEATIETLYQLVPARPTAASGTLVALVFELVKVVLAIMGTIFYWTAGKDVQESLDYAETHGENIVDEADRTDEQITGQSSL